jgi:AraC-like DNA-binding protein
VFRGPIIDALAARGPRFLPIAPGQLAGILAGVADDDELALAEAICQLADDPEDPGAEDPGAADPGARPAAAAGDRDLTATIAEALRAGYAEPTSLGELAATAGYSVFHACRVFRATTGATIHGFRRELRLRHALARILAGDEPLTEVALATGFASQSHLTNRFRARFGVTPARARTRDRRRRLLAHSMSIDLNVP